MIDSKAFLLIDGIDVFNISNRETSIGRAYNNDLVLSHSNVSRKHAKLTLIQDKFLLADLNSTGGTMINGRPTIQTLINPGDVITLANSVQLTFYIDPTLLPDAALPYSPPAEKPDTPDVSTGHLKQ